MDKQSLVLERFLLGFEGTRLNDELRDLLAGGLAGVAIFHRNFTSVEGLHALTDEIRAAAGRPVLIGIDQEGGLRFSLPEPFTQWPCAAELGLLDDADLAERVARAMARELRAAGCNLNFAPMLDLHTNAASPVTTERSFGADPHRVAELGAAVIRGLAREGVLPCAKHFPGHGDAQVDPHEDLPVFHGDARRLEEMELVPFARAIAAGVPLVMTAHILLPEIDPSRPASLSKKMLSETLRQKMGFRGVVLADDLGMGAIRRRYGPAEAAIAAVEAGTDVVALCDDWAAVRLAINAVQKRFVEGRFDAAEWEASHQRIERLRGECSRGSSDPADLLSLDVIGCEEHRALSAEIRERIGERQRR